MNKNYAERSRRTRCHPSETPELIIPRNLDGTLNHAGQITHFTWIQAKVEKRKLLKKLLITDLGSSDVIFGLPWFKENDPQIVWKTGRVQLLKANLDTTFLYLAKDKQRRKEIQQEQKELQQSPSKKEEEIDCPSNKPNWRE